MNASEYYSQNVYLAQVDRDDTIVGKVERWLAHKESILHRGFTTVLKYQDKYLLQHRKHPAFDGFWDFTFSSHQIYENDIPLGDIDSIYNTLEREWNLESRDLLVQPVKLGSFYYKAKDPNSIFTEHEIDRIYLAELKNLPIGNSEYAYGYQMIDKHNGRPVINLQKYTLAPWVAKILELKLE